LDAKIKLDRLMVRAVLHYEESLSQNG
jgi:hypothetical protein